METNPKKQRHHFYRDYASGQWSMSELCDRYQISRPTGYKWIVTLFPEGTGSLDGSTDKLARSREATMCKGCAWTSVRDVPGPYRRLT
jgi:hypothetical protein